MKRFESVLFALFFIALFYYITVHLFSLWTVYFTTVFELSNRVQYVYRQPATWYDSICTKGNTVIVVANSYFLLRVAEKRFLALKSMTMLPHK